MTKHRIIIGISGASGATYGITALKILAGLPDYETHLVVSSAGEKTIAYETTMSVADVKKLADHVYDERDIGAAIASGSFKTLGMLVAPCSIKTLSAVANCYADNLIARAADVCLKERRKLILMVRETPFHAGHIRLMDIATQSGAIIMPPLPAFYNHPQTIDEMVNDTVTRALAMLGVGDLSVKEWQ